MGYQSQTFTDYESYYEYLRIILRYIFGELTVDQSPGQPTTSQGDRGKKEGKRCRHQQAWSTLPHRWHHPISMRIFVDKNQKHITHWCYQMIRNSENWISETNLFDSPARCCEEKGKSKSTIVQEWKCCASAIVAKQRQSTSIVSGGEAMLVMEESHGLYLCVSYSLEIWRCPPSLHWENKNTKTTRIEENYNLRFLEIAK